MDVISQIVNLHAHRKMSYISRFIVSSIYSSTKFLFHISFGFFCTYASPSSFFLCICTLLFHSSASFDAMINTFLRHFPLFSLPFVFHAVCHRYEFSTFIVITFILAACIYAVLCSCCCSFCHASHHLITFIYIIWCYKNVTQQSRSIEP